MSYDRASLSNSYFPYKTFVLGTSSKRQNLRDFLDDVYNREELFGKVLSLMRFPFDARKLGSSYVDDDYIYNPAEAGGTEFSEKSGVIRFNEGQSSGAKPIDMGSVTIEERFGDFRDRDPKWTQIRAYFPYCGFLDLDPGVVVGRPLKFSYGIDVTTGNCTAYVRTTDDQQREFVMATINGKCGIEVPTIQSNMQEVSRAIATSLFTAIAGIVGSVAIGGTAGGIMLFGTATQAFNTAINRTLPKTQSGNVGNGREALFSGKNVVVTVTQAIPGDMTGYADTYGRPLRQYLTLNSFVGKGFTQVSDIHLALTDGALSEERDEIVRLLKKGVIL